jgi:hypothetical protein
MSRNKNWNKENRKLRAIERQQEYDKLSPQERIVKLDTQNEPGMGAKKQRARIFAQIKNNNPFKRRKKSKKREK